MSRRRSFPARRWLWRGGSLDTHDRTPARLRHLTRVRRQDRTGGRGHRPGCVGAGRPSERGSRGPALSDASGAYTRCGSPGSGAARDGGAGERSGGSATAATGRDADSAGDPEPRVRVGEFVGAVGLPQGCLASGPGPVRIRRYATRRGARNGPTAAGSWPGAAAATRIHLAERPGVQRPSAGARPRRTGTAAWVLPVERAAAARVLRHSVNTIPLAAPPTLPLGPPRP
jgi:hypothetical protein